MFRVLFYATVFDSESTAPSPRQTRRYGRMEDARANVQQREIYPCCGYLRSRHAASGVPTQRESRTSATSSTARPRQVGSGHPYVYVKTYITVFMEARTSTLRCHWYFSSHCPHIALTEIRVAVHIDGCAGACLFRVALRAQPIFDARTIRI